jgi:hypothetical protein
MKTIRILGREANTLAYGEACLTKSYQTLGVELMQYDKRKDMTNVEGFKRSPSLLPRPHTNGNPRPGYTRKFGKIIKVTTRIAWFGRVLVHAIVVTSHLEIPSLLSLILE